MKSNFKMTQSTNAEIGSIYFPSPLESEQVTNTPFTTYELGTTPRRNLAWRVAPDLMTSFQYAWAGVRYAFTTQRNFRIHTFIGIVAIAMGLYLKATPVEMAVLSLTSALVMVLELLNTALESVVDLSVGQSYHELAKIAKDCAAGAVLISAIAALLVASFILLPLLLTVIL